MGGSKDFPITDHEFAPCNCEDPECTYCAICKQQRCFLGLSSDASLKNATEARSKDDKITDFEQRLFARRPLFGEQNARYRLDPASIRIVDQLMSLRRHGHIKLSDQEFLACIALHLADAMDAMEEREYQRLCTALPPAVIIVKEKP